MLPLQLLRIRITKKGKNIAPLFCTSVDEKFAEQLQLAQRSLKSLKNPQRRKTETVRLQKEFPLWNLSMIVINL